MRAERFVAAGGERHRISWWRGGLLVRVAPISAFAVYDHAAGERHPPTKLHAVQRAQEGGCPEVVVVDVVGNVVEVDATIDVREPDDVDGDRHYRLRVRVDDVLHGDPDVDADIERNVENHSDVFVAIRYGDRMGILEPIPGLDPGVKLRLKGEWIPRDQAQNHGGEKMSVLHFTHHPIGFTCTPQKCFS